MTIGRPPTYPLGMQCKEIVISEAGEYLLGVFRALLDIPKFRAFVDENFIIEQYYDGADGKILRVELKDKLNGKIIEKEKSTLH